MSTRKRRAPGSEPQAPMQTYPQDASIPTDQYMNWNDPTMSADMGAFNDPALFDNYNTNTISSGHNRVVSLDGMHDAPDMSSGQLVRRNPNQQLAPAPRRGQWDGYPSPTQQWDNIADDDEELDQKAAVAKKDAQAKRKQIPPFVQKLSSFLDNNKNENLIRWSDDGNSFIVLDEDEFARTLIPELFKHNNYASFVRQLNMYGFHKKVGLSDNSMKASETKAKAPSEYYNKYFKRGRPELLWLIQKPKNPMTGPKRKRDDEAKGDSDEERKYVQDTGGGGYIEELTPVRRSDDMAMIPRSEYNSLRVEVRELQQQQKLISNVLGQIKRQNDELYSRATSFQALHDRHENSINAILTFLATFYKRGLEGNTGGINLADMFSGARQQTHGNVVDVGDYQAPEMNRSPSFQRKKQPLALLPAPAPGKDYLAPPGGRATTMSPTTRPMPSPITRQNSQQAVFRSPSHTKPQSSTSTPQARDGSSSIPLPKVESQSPQTMGPLPEAEEMLSAIQDANTNAGHSSSQAPQFDFPAAFSNYQTADGAVPLTAQQRNDVLSLMANNTAASNTNNALTNPNPPEMNNLLNDLSRFQETQQQLELLQKMSDQQNSRVQSLQERLQPLSPSGQIPGLTENNTNYFGNQLGDPSQYDLDLDSFVQDNDYFPNSTSLPPNGNATDPNSVLPDFNYDLPDTNPGMSGGGNFTDTFDFGTHDDGTLHVGDANDARESVSSSGTSPAATVEEVEDETRRRSPKRRRK
ncbi:Heat shock transcription factor [Ascochyta rabiei]|uniref:Sequence-specific DNA binding n=1 Tax=Didymella rabiei TaxID=5454 RepID=A0A163BKU1_DIDRA|nr:Heat shock transcription factor [Ascochyta rabiei]KZM21826.1 sequence-specific DNA binding [Ascochyta rabiei]UPX12608.1 Heat shock transcription factor [Ascochyta rabiei]